MKIYNFENLKSRITKRENKKLLKKVFSSLKNVWRKRGFWIWTFRLFATGIAAIAMLFLYYAQSLPDPNKLLSRSVPESTKIFSKDEKLLYEIHGEEKRTLVDLDQISEFAKNAAVAIEDKNFYQHRGISVKGILRAVIYDVLSLKKSQGGSTITQQFVKNAILSREKSWDRKIREIFLSIAIESRYSKDEILKMYLNEIPYGGNTYGIEAASETYFKKNASNLTLAESAYLAAIPQSPTFYNPLGQNRSSLDTRKNTVLRAMREQGYITPEQEEQAKSEIVAFQKSKTGIIAPHFVMMVQSYLSEKFGEKTLEEGGLKIYTTLDTKLQELAENAISAFAEKNQKQYNANNAALVAIDPKTGYILAMAGGKDYFGKSFPENCKPGKNCLFEPNVNVAIAERQPGSSFKPYVYVTAFNKEHKMSPATMLVDVVTDFGTFAGKNYVPQNYDGSERGPISIRQALAGSLNIPAVKVLSLIGVENAVQTARSLGITSPLQNCGLSLVLGGCEVKLLDHVSAYSVMANMGVKNKQTAILKIVNKDGKTLEEYKPDPETVLDPESVYELISIMTDNNARSFVFGSNSPLTLGERPVAAKTGTTQSWKDGWTVGFTPSLAAGVWVGNNDGTLLKKGADGVLVAAPIWNNFMKNALSGTPIENFTKPEGITEIVVDKISGKLPTSETPETKTEIFASFSVPTEYDNVHLRIKIDTLTGLKADENTPPDRVAYQNITVLKSEQPNLPNWEAPVAAWAQANGYFYSQNTLNPVQLSNNITLSFFAPQDGEVIFNLPLSGEVNVSSLSEINSIELKLDGETIATLTQAPYRFVIDKDIESGEHILAAKAYANGGNTAETSVSFQYLPPSAMLQVPSQ